MCNFNVLLKDYLEVILRKQAGSENGNGQQVSEHRNDIPALKVWLIFIKLYFAVENTIHFVRFMKRECIKKNNSLKKNIL